MRHLMPELLATMLPILLFGGLLSLVPVLIKRWLISNGGMGFNYRAKRIMTSNEMEFFQRLSRANPDGYVFPQVAFSALLQPSSRNKWAAFKYIAQKRVDYAIYNSKLELLCIVELDDRTHNLKKDAQRDAAFASAGIVTLRWQSSNKPNEHEIRTQFEQLRLSKAA